MINEWTQALNELVLDFGSFVNNVLSIPSKAIPLLSSNMILIMLSILFGYFYGKHSKADFRVLVGIIFSLLFYMSMRFINIGG